MKKVIRLTESQLENIIRKVISEQYIKEDLEQGMTDIERYNYNRGIQCFLNKKGIKDDKGNKLVMDGSIGNYPKSKSAQAIYRYQEIIKVYPVDGVWGQDTIEAMPDADKKIFKDCISKYGDLFDKIYHYFGWDE